MSYIQNFTGVSYPIHSTVESVKDTVKDTVKDVKGAVNVQSPVKRWLALLWYYARCHDPD